jgi:hypothetical protein
MMTLRSTVTPLALLVLLGLAGCGHESSTRQLSERERDSTLGKSAIPGASAVTRALSESDKASAAAHSTDTQVDSLPH